MRPARMWTAEAVAAATPDTAMFAPPPAAADEATATITGSLRLPSTSPTRPPTSATAKHQRPTRASSTGGSEAR